MRTQHCKCRQCGKRYIYEYGGDKGYDTELCSSLCDGIEIGMKRRQKDFDAREKQWKEVVWELSEHLKLEVRRCHCDDALDGHYCCWCNKRHNLIEAALALLNEPQPQEDKSHDDDEV